MEQNTVCEVGINKLLILFLSPMNVILCEIGHHSNIPTPRHLTVVRIREVNFFLTNTTLPYRAGGVWAITWLCLRYIIKYYFVKAFIDFENMCSLAYHSDFRKPKHEKLAESNCRILVTNYAFSARDNCILKSSII